MSWIDRAERKFGWLGVSNLTLYVVIGQIVTFVLSMIEPGVVEKLILVPGLVMQGEVWRLITFAVMVPATNPLWAFFAVYLFYLFGTALEGQWGPFRYTLYLLIGYVFTVAVAFMWPERYSTNVYLESTVFLAFAFLFPSFELLLFFILPVKVKWLGLLTWLSYVYFCLVGDNHMRGLIGAAAASFMLYFGRELIDMVRNRKRAAENRTQWKRKMHEAEREKPETGEPRHRCKACDLTDVSSPETLFFYSDSGDCYCEQHKALADATEGSDA